MRRFAALCTVGLSLVGCGSGSSTRSDGDCVGENCTTDSAETTDGVGRTDGAPEVTDSGVAESDANGESTDGSNATATDSSSSTDDPGPVDPGTTDSDGTDGAGDETDAPEPDAGAEEITDDSASDIPGTDVEATDVASAEGTDGEFTDDVSTDGEGTDEPATDEVETDQEVATDAEDLEPFEEAPVLQGQPDKVDLLFVIDNSISMFDKQQLLADALPDLVERLVNPNCRDADGNLEAPDGGACSAGSVLEFPPIADLHLGIITTSLGGYGSYGDCKNVLTREQHEDMAHLLGSLPRGAAAVPSAAASGFLSWSAGDDSGPLVSDFADLAVTAGEFGCGWEASLESWVRFLVDPFPYTTVVRQPCSVSDTNNLCAGPELDAEGNQLVDITVLNQRAQFLRPNSLLSIVMFSDESDCSFKASGQSWRLAETVTEQGLFNPGFKATGACDDPTMGPNHECCTSCGVVSIPDGCPAATNQTAETVALGCEDGRRYGADGDGDSPNLRCFQQQRRFGVDYLYPLQRYTNALTLESVCATNDDLSPQDCDMPLVRNPIFGLLDGARRPDNWVFLAGIVGVPWQDIAVEPSSSEPLRYRNNREGTDEPINWDWILGDVDPVLGYPTPLDPLMREQIEPRTGVNPATGVALAAPDGTYLQNPINGHEWNIADANDLQFACIFPIEAVECPDQDEVQDRQDAGELVPACDCTDFGGDEYQSPLCQAPDGSYDATQRFGKAYPGVRQLQVLRAFGANSVVASICPKTASDANAADFGYRPAVNALLERFGEALNGQ